MTRPFSLQEHRDIGESLLAIRQYVAGIVDEISDRYGRDVSRQRCGYIVSRLDRMRKGLQNQLFEDMNVVPPNRELASIYYPPVRQAAGQAEGVQA